MRLYVNAKGEWVGTQAEAKKIAAIQIEVPTDKQGLMHFLNTESVLRNVQTYGNRGSTEPAVQPPAAPPLTGGEPAHHLSCSTNKAARDLSQYEVRDVVLNCDKQHLASALGAIISRINDLEI